jgi:hypothetical protein
MSALRLTCAVAALLGAACGTSRECGPARDGLEVMVEGNLLAPAKLTVLPGARDDARVSLVMNDTVLAGRGVCKDSVLAIELEPGAALPDGSQLIGGEVVLANGVMGDARLFGTWAVSMRGPKGDHTARGFLSARGTERPSQPLAKAP